MRKLAVFVLFLAVAGCGGARHTHVSAHPAVSPAFAVGGARHSHVHARTGRVEPEIDHGARTRRWVALTFDADMTRSMLARLRSGLQRTWYDARIISELRAARAPATIFLTGLWTLAYPNVVRELARDPRFELENHSVDHAGWLAPCWGLPVARGALSKWAEIEDAARIIRRVAGVTPRYFRFPGGCHDQRDLRLVTAAGERAVGWDVVSADAFQPNPHAIARAVLGAVRPGSIVIMHLVGAPNAPATALALPRILAGLRARGYKLVTIRALVGS